MPSICQHSVVDYLLVGDLFMAMALRGNVGLLEEMAARGVTAKILGPTGRTLLMHAVHYAARCRGELRRRMVAGVVCLLQHGADPNLADE